MSFLHNTALLLCTIALATDARAATTDAYAYAWPVQTQGTGAAWQVEMTPEVYAAADADLRDVEVVNAAGDAVPAAPYRPVSATPRATEALIDVPRFDIPGTADRAAGADNEAIRVQVERGADGRLRRVDANVGGATPPLAAAVRTDVLLDASAVRDAFAALRLDWDAGADVSAQFAVDASDDLQQWHTVVARATVLRLNQDGNLLDRHDVALNRIHAAYLRVRRLDNGAPLPGFAIRLRTTAPSSAKQTARQWLQAATDGSDVKHLDTGFASGDGQRAVAWLYHLPAALTIDSLRLELADDNSLARVHVLSRMHGGDAAKPVWNRRADFVAFRLRQGDAVIGNDEIAAMPAAAARDWRVEFATPLEHAPVLSVAYLPHRFVFLAQGSGPYRLVAGSARARRGDYPIDAALASLRASQGSDWQPPLAVLGTRATLQGDAAMVPAPPPAPPRDWKSWLLWGVLIGAAALIGGMAMSLLRSQK